MFVITLTQDKMLWQDGNEEKVNEKDYKLTLPECLSNVSH